MSQLAVNKLDGRCEACDIAATLNDQVWYPALITAMRIWKGPGHVNGVGRSIFRAVHERRWLSIEYRNRDKKVTRYWIGVRGIDVGTNTLSVRGLHLGTFEIADLDHVRIDSILSAAIVEGTYFDTPDTLLDDIDLNEEKYRLLFGMVPNMRILDYLEACNRLNTTPYVSDYALIERLDADRFENDEMPLDDSQYAELIRAFQDDAKNRSKPGSAARKLSSLALNLLSVHTPKGLYALAYRKVRLDVERRMLVAALEPELCREFMVGAQTAAPERGTGSPMRTRMSVTRFMDSDELYLLDDFTRNQEAIKDAIAAGLARGSSVDDRPYLMAIGRDLHIDLTPEYDAIFRMFAANEQTVPLKAFFGELTRRPIRRKERPIVLTDRRVDLDQLLAMHMALKYPLTYVQGPPGTGKTRTIVNTVLSAFFDKRTVLFSAFNNHPVDGVFDSLRELRYQGTPIPFPVVRIGNNAQVMPAALTAMRALYEQACRIKVPIGAFESGSIAETEKTRLLGSLLKSYAERLELEERKECIEQLMESSANLNFNAELSARQLPEVERRLAELGEEPDVEMALQLACMDPDGLMRCFMYASVQHLRRLDEPRAADLKHIIMSDEAVNDRVAAFNKYLSDPEGLKTFLRIFPIVLSTCISAGKLGDPSPSFDLCIIDEAGQCDNAIALVPIVRGRNLLLVGDPQQLNPVVVLDPLVNKELRRAYRISDEYDYIDNSVYKTMLACDAVSDEVLLSHHYRCDDKIIGFNNSKYYSERLHMCRGNVGDDALTYLSIEFDTSDVKNTAPAEVDAIEQYVRAHPDDDIGIITPFVNQRVALDDMVRRCGFPNVSCGTVHSFQGDEKDTVVFSLALTDKTHVKTYEWLANNRELINVATSRAKDKLVVVASSDELERLHGQIEGPDDLYELVGYVQSNGATKVQPRQYASRALGVKPFSTATETAFLETLDHALGNIFLGNRRHLVHKEVAISHVFGSGVVEPGLFFSGRFDFVVYERASDGSELPVLAIELDGAEHRSEEAVKARDQKKAAICRAHGLELIRVDNSYARRYNYIKDVLSGFFSKR